MFDFFKDHRRDKILSTPFPAEWDTILRVNFPLYARLGDADREALQRKIQVFVAEKIFEGAGGVHIDDEIRVTIAAQACLLILHRDNDHYPGLRTVIVYPSAFISTVKEQVGYGVMREGRSIRLGEAWGHGTIVLSWDHVRAGAAAIDDGHNLVYHEFAHQLDHEDGSANGAPILDKRSMYEEWSRVLGEAFASLQRESALGRMSVLDPYGATSPAEFFAVATEAFFEKPWQLRGRYPDLYNELKLYYQQDPVKFFDEPVEESGEGNDIEIELL